MLRNVTGTWRVRQCRRDPVARDVENLLWLSADSKSRDVRLLHTPWLLRQECDYDSGTDVKGILIETDDRDELPTTDGAHRCCISTDGVTLAVRRGSVDTRERLKLVSRAELLQEITRQDHEGTSTETRSWRRIESADERILHEGWWRKAGGQVGAEPLSDADDDAPGGAQVDPAPVTAWACPDFTGAWAVDRSCSDSMDGVLAMMGLPWLVRKVADGLDIVTVIAHSPAAAAVTTIEKVGKTILNSNEMATDGVAVDKKDNKGKVANVTCSVYAPPASESHTSEGDSNSTDVPLACMRITTVMPEGIGVSDNVWTLMGPDGKRLKQRLVYTRGDKEVVCNRVLFNKEWKEPPAIFAAAARPAASSLAMTAPHSTASTHDPETSPASATADASITSSLTSTDPVVGAPASVRSAPSLQSSRLPVAKSSRPQVVNEAAPSAAAAAPTFDPFFVSLSGSWVVDKARSQPTDGMWKAAGMSRGQRAAAAAAQAAGCVIRHASSDAISMTQGKRTTSLIMDNQWRLVKQVDGRVLLTRARQDAGSGGLSERWLGYEAGGAAAPAATASLPSAPAFASPTKARGAVNRAPATPSSPASSIISAATGRSAGVGPRAGTTAGARRSSFVTATSGGGAGGGRTPAGAGVGPSMRGSASKQRAAVAATPQQQQRVPAPYYSGLPFEPLRYCESRIVVETILVPPSVTSSSSSSSSSSRSDDHGAGVAWSGKQLPAGPRLTVTHYRQSSQTIVQTYVVSDGSPKDSVPLAECRLVLVHSDEADAKGAAKDEKRRQATARAIILSRRADADKARRAHLMGEGGSGNRQATVSETAAVASSAGAPASSVVTAMALGQTASGIAASAAPIHGALPQDDDDNESLEETVEGEGCIVQ